MNPRITVAAALAVVGVGAVVYATRAETPTPPTALATQTTSAPLSGNEFTAPSGLDEEITVVLPSTGETIKIAKPSKKAVVLPRNQGTKYGHDNIDASRQPSEAGLSTDGMPGTYIGAVPQTPEFTSYVWETKPLATIEQSRATARSRFLEVKQLLLDQGWVVASDYVEFLDRVVPDSDPSYRDIYVVQSFARDGAMASLRIACSRVTGFGYNMVAINVGPAYGPPTDESETQP